MAVVDLTPEQEASIDAALERAKHHSDEPIALTASYDLRLDAIVLQLSGERRLILPRAELEGLEHATQAQIAEIQVYSGNDICWPQLDLDHYLPALLAGQYGSAKWMRALEMRGMTDNARNSSSAFAKSKAFHDLYPLTAPFGSVEHQELLGVREVSRQGATTGVALVFESNALVIAAHIDDTIEVTLHASDFAGTDISHSEQWKNLVGLELRLHWLAMDQRGYLDTVLLAFGDTTIPQVALKVDDRQLKVRRLITD